MKLEKGLLDGLIQFVSFERFQQIVGRAETERLLGVGKFVVAADHDDARVECRGLTDPAEKGKSVHPRHADIRENDVRMQLACQLQRIGSVVGFLDPADGQCGRIEQFPHGDPDRRLIICNQ